MIRKLLVSLCLLIGGITAYAQCAQRTTPYNRERLSVMSLSSTGSYLDQCRMGKDDCEQYGISRRAVPEDRLQSYTNKKIDFFFKMRDTLTCITSRQLEPLYFRKGAEEGKRYTVDEVKFSYKDGNALSTSSARCTAIPTSIMTRYRYVYTICSASCCRPASYDPTDYRPGTKILFSMATGREIEKQTLIYRGKENFTAENDVTYRCLVFSLVEYVNNKEKEVITFYVTET